MSTPKEQRPEMGPTPRTDALDCCEVFDKNGQPYAAMLVPSNFARELERELAAERAVNAELVAALKEICRGEGAFSRDQLEHASNVISNLISIATEALARTKEASK